MLNDLPPIRLTHLGWEILVLPEAQAQWLFHAHELETDDRVSSGALYASQDHAIFAAKCTIDRISSVVELGQFLDELLIQNKITADEYASALSLLGRLGR